MKTVTIQGTIRRMVPQVCTYRAEVDVDEEDLEHMSDFMEQFFNDEVRWSGEHTIMFTTVNENAQDYLQEHFCSDSDLDFQCTEYEIIS